MTLSSLLSGLKLIVKASSCDFDFVTPGPLELGEMADVDLPLFL